MSPRLVLSSYDLSVCEDIEQELRFAGIDPEESFVRINQCDGSVMFVQSPEEDDI